MRFARLREARHRIHCRRHGGSGVPLLADFTQRRPHQSERQERRIGVSRGRGNARAHRRQVPIGEIADSPGIAASGAAAFMQASAMPAWRLRSSRLAIAAIGQDARSESEDRRHRSFPPIARIRRWFRPACDRARRAAPRSDRRMICSGNWWRSIVSISAAATGLPAACSRETPVTTSRHHCSRTSPASGSLTRPETCAISMSKA